MKLISKFDIPNILTYTRLVFAPLFVAIFYFDNNFAKVLAGIIFVIAGITDFLDGFLARRWEVISTVGVVLDPIADKLIVTCALIMLIFHGVILDINVIAAIIIFAREVVISGLREVLSKFQFDIPVSNSGKYKAALQIISIGCLIFSDIDFFKNLTLDFNIMKFTGLCLLWIASFLSITSGLGYVNQAIQFLKKNR